MANTDLDQQLQQLADGIVALRQDLTKSEDMEAVPGATALVAAVKLNTAFARFADATRKGIAPLFGKKPGDGGGQEGAKPKPRRPRK